MPAPDTIYLGKRKSVERFCCRSNLTGLVVMALVLGLAHAPGFYLRPEATGGPWVRTPGCYWRCVITSVSGFFLGVLWIRTRNLALRALVHTAGDLLPYLAQTIQLWRA